MKTKHYSSLVGALVASLFAGAALAVTPQEAKVQLDRIPAADKRQAAKDVLKTLVSSGASVDQALAVVSGAVTRNYSATEMRQVGAEMREQMQQQIPSEYVAKTAENAINANRSATDTVKTLNTFQSQVTQGVPAKQAFDAVNADMAGSGTGGGSPAARSGTGTGTSNTTQTGTGTGTGSDAARSGTGTGTSNTTQTGTGTGDSSAKPAVPEKKKPVTGFGSGTGMGGTPGGSMGGAPGGGMGGAPGGAPGGRQ